MTLDEHITKIINDTLLEVRGDLHAAMKILNVGRTIIENRTDKLIYRGGKKQRENALIKAGLIKEVIEALEE